MDISGRLFKVSSVQTGNGQGGPWSKLDFVIETEDRYPKKVCFSAWGERVADVQRLSMGENIRVHFDVSSREYNEKWYTDLRAWKIDTGASALTAPTSPQAQNPNPAATPSTQTAAAPAFQAPAPDDDLPF